MYLEIDNRGPITAREGTQRALTTLIFPDGIELDEAILTAREAIGYHVAEGQIAKLRSDNPDLAAALEQYYGLKPTPKPNGNGTTSVVASLIMAGLIIAVTRCQLRYNNGASWQAGIMGNPSSTGSGAYAPGIFMGISSDSTAPAAGDSTLVGEVTSGTLARALCTYAYTTAATSYTESKVFTSDQTITIYKAALFTASSGGQPIFGSLLMTGGTNSPKSLFSGDQVGITETVNF